MGSTFFEFYGNVKETVAYRYLVYDQNDCALGILNAEKKTICMVPCQEN